MPLEDLKSMVMEILSTAGVLKPPIPIKKVARKLRVKIKSETLDEDVSGLLYKEEERILIIVNKAHHENRQRFTSAHELGHFVLEHKGRFFVDNATLIYRDTASSTGEVEEEREANGFAAELLMPEAFIRRDVKKPIDARNETSIDKLAQKYRVSGQAMTYRLAKLGLLR